MSPGLGCWPAGRPGGARGGPARRLGRGGRGAGAPRLVSGFWSPVRRARGRGLAFGRRSFSPPCAAGCRAGRFWHWDLRRETTLGRARGWEGSRGGGDKNARAPLSPPPACPGSSRPGAGVPQLYRYLIVILPRVVFFSRFFTPGRHWGTHAIGFVSFSLPTSQVSLDRGAGRSSRSALRTVGGRLATRGSFGPGFLSSPLGLSGSSLTLSSPLLQLSPVGPALQLFHPLLLRPGGGARVVAVRREGGRGGPAASSTSSLAPTARRPAAGSSSTAAGAQPTVRCGPPLLPSFHSCSSSAGGALGGGGGTFELITQIRWACNFDAAAGRQHPASGCVDEHLYYYYEMRPPGNMRGLRRRTRLNTAHPNLVGIPTTSAATPTARKRSKLDTSAVWR